MSSKNHRNSSPAEACNNNLKNPPKLPRADSYPAGKPPLWPAPAFDEAASPYLGRRGIRATVEVDGSKSLTNRHLLLASLADKTSTIGNVPESRDSHLMMEALKTLGATIETSEAATGTYRVTPREDSANRAKTSGKKAGTTADLGRRTIDCGLAGTVMRFIPPLAAISRGIFTFDGDRQARKRPMRAIIAALRSLGVTVDCADENSLPFTVHGQGRISGGKLAIDASASSQFVSALLLAGAFFDDGLHLIHQGGPLPSAPHINMTIQTLAQWGIHVDNPQEGQWRVAPIGTTIKVAQKNHYQAVKSQRLTIEQDLSNIGPFVAAAQVTGGVLRVPRWPENTTQVGAQWCPILKRFGTKISRATEPARAGETPGGFVMTFAAPRTYQGCDIDLSEAGELSPTIAAIALFAKSPSRLRGIAHLRGHETDRLAALTQEFAKLGVVVDETEDGLNIFPPAATGQYLHPPHDYFHTYADHRMATTAAVIGLRVPGLMVEDISCTRKTLSDFPGLWETMLRDSRHGSGDTGFSPCNASGECR